MSERRCAAHNSRHDCPNEIDEIAATNEREDSKNIQELDVWCAQHEGSHRTSPATPDGKSACQLAWWRPNKARSKTFKAGSPRGARALAADFCRENPNAR